MIIVFHGDDNAASRQALNLYLEKQSDSDILRTDSKGLDLNQVLSFISTTSFIRPQKILVVSNFFSLPKASLDKILKSVGQEQNTSLAIWQDKALTATQLRQLPQAQTNLFRHDNQLYLCLNLIKPGNIARVAPLYRQLCQKDLFDLFLYLLKGSLRRQLQTNPKFNPPHLKKCYLKLIELEYLYKSGKLTTPKDIALETVLIELMQSQSK